MLIIPNGFITLMLLISRASKTELLNCSISHSNRFLYSMDTLLYLICYWTHIVVCSSVNAVVCIDIIFHSPTRQEYPISRTYFCFNVLTATHFMIFFVAPPFEKSCWEMSDWDLSAWKSASKFLCQHGNIKWNDNSLLGLLLPVQPLYSP